MSKFKIIFIAFGLFISVQNFAQIKFGVKAGANLNSMKFDVDNDFGDEPETKVKAGFHIGVTADIPIVDEFLSVQPALLFNNKGYSLDVEKTLEDTYEPFNLDVDDVDGYSRSNYNYIELPINVVYKFEDFQAAVGPYFALGIGGKFKHNYSFEVNGIDFDSDDNFDESSYQIQPVFGEIDEDAFQDYLDDDDVIEQYRAFDFGLNLGIGYQLDTMLFNISYSHGMNNLTPKYDVSNYLDDDYTDGVVQKNRVVTFSVTYYLFKFD